jgi:hypothetical protein
VRGILAFKSREVRGREICLGEVLARGHVVGLAEGHEGCAGGDGLGEEVGCGDGVDAVVAGVDVEDAPVQKEGLAYSRMQA